MKILIILTAISIVVLGPFAVSGGDQPVAQAIITTGVTNASPETDHLTVIDHGVGSITFYTEIIGLRGQTVSHRWLYNNHEIASISLHIAANRSLNWTQTTIHPDQLGTWTAQLITANGTVLTSQNFEVVQSSRGMQRAVQKTSIVRCSDQLKDLEEKIQQNPNVDYYRFLYQKQSARCK